MFARELSFRGVLVFFTHIWDGGFCVILDTVVTLSADLWGFVFPVGFFLLLALSLHDSMLPGL